MSIFFYTKVNSVLFLTSIIYKPEKVKLPNLAFGFPYLTICLEECVFCGELWECINVSCYLWCSTHCVYCLVYACLKKKSTSSSNCCVNALVSGLFDFYMSTMLNKRWWSGNNLCLWQGINYGLRYFNLFPRQPLAAFTK